MNRSPPRLLWERGGEWAIFVATALVPAALGVGLGLRALANEDSARRRELAANLARTAEFAVSRLQNELSRGAADLESAKYSDVAGDAPPVSEWFRETIALAPSPAQAVVVSPSGRLLEPAPGIAAPDAAAKDDPATRECRALARGLAGSSDIAVRKAKIVARCPEVRTDLGRYLWLSLAVGALVTHPEDRALASSLASWVEGHAGALRAAERVDARAEIAALDGLEPSVAARIVGALDRGESDTDLVERALTADAAAKALHAERTTSFRGLGSVGTLRALKSGHVVGYVATEDTVRRALAREPESYGANDSISIDVATASEPRSDLSATEWLAPGLGLRAKARDPHAFENHTLVSRWLVGLTAALGAVVAVVLASVLFLRMRAARRTSALRTSFVAAVSHELRTPIASIRMLAELLEEERVEPSERAEVFEALAKESRRLGETVDRLLGFTRMAANKLVLDRRVERLADPLRRALAAFRGRNPTIAIDEAIDDDVRADIDAGQIEHVVANLLENARKHAPRGEPYRLSLRRIADAAVISVEDHGPGIPRGHHRRIFDAFERGDDRLSKATEGSGIGLSLTMYIAKAHGGRAWVESVVGRGATFFVSLPCVAARSREQEREET